MPYTLDDYQRDAWERMLKVMPPKKRFEGLSAEELLDSIPLERIPTEQLLARMSSDDIEAYLNKLKNKPNSDNE